MKKIIFICLFSLLLINCSSNQLCYSGAMGDDWCIENCTDENFRNKLIERQARLKEENKTPEERFNDKIKTIIGKSQKDIIFEFGVPTKTEEIGGLQILSYIEDGESKVTYKSGGSGFTYGNNTFSNSSGSMKSEYSFKRKDFIFENNKLIKGTYTER